MAGFRAKGTLSLILLDYVAPLDAVDAHMKAHVAWLDDHLADGTFLLAGRQHPRSGGVILARGDRATVETIAARDPFVTEGVAESRVIEFNASFAAPEIAALLA